MSKEEKILLGVALVALMAVVIFQRPQTVLPSVIAANDPVSEVGVSMTPNNDSVVRGPAYMTYNAPFFFAPPVSNFLPSITAGQAGQTVNSPTNFAGDDSCGCE